MPRLAIDYAKNFNYKIVCKDLSITDSYAGSSTNWSKRKNCHKSSCNNENSKKYHLKVYQFIREHGGWNNWNMILIEYYPCKTQLESAQRERYWTETLKATLNCQVPGRTQAECQAVYQANHKEKILSQQAVPYTCVCGSCITTHGKSQHEKTQKHCSFILLHPIIEV
jgi:hypothetical protein